MLAKVDAGERVTTKKVKAIVAKHKPSKRERRLRQNLGERRAEQFVQTHPGLMEPQKKAPLTALIDEAEEILRDMDKVAKAAVVRTTCRKGPRSAGFQPPSRR